MFHVKHCPGCASPRTKPYRFRPPKPHHPDPDMCPYGQPKATHICVATCATTGTLCLNCRIVTGPA